MIQTTMHDARLALRKLLHTHDWCRERQAAALVIDWLRTLSNAT